MCITCSQNRSSKTNKISPQLSTINNDFPQVIKSKIAVNKIFFLTFTFLWIVDNLNYLSLNYCFLYDSFPQYYPHIHKKELDYVY